MVEKSTSSKTEFKANTLDADFGGIQKGLRKAKWYRSTYYNALILGLCNFCAPGIWGAMNSLGAGGEELPYLVNAANALTFCLMVVSCYFSSVLVKYIGIKWALVFGTMGYAPFAAGLYTNNRFGTEWLVLFGAACCGICAGVFWMAEAAIALSYPEPFNQGRFLGFWLSFRLGGQVLGGAINLGLNVKNGEKGKVSYNVYLAFIAIQCCGPLLGLLLTPPEKVQRTDGLKVHLKVTDNAWNEMKATAKLFCSKRFLLIVPLIAQAVYTEAVMFTFQALWFSVRARALGSFLGGILAIAVGNLLGWFLDRGQIPLKIRSRTAFLIIFGLQGAWWTWGTVLVHDYNQRQPLYDWTNGSGFANGFTLLLCWVGSFQANYMYLYFVVGNLARDEAEVVRIAALLRGTESAAQAVSYGLNSIAIIAAIGGVYINFGIWFVALLPAWLVIREFGTTMGDGKLERDLVENNKPVDSASAAAVFSSKPEDVA